MKNFLIVICAFLLTSCTVAFPLIKMASFIDFTQYKDFYISQSPTADFKYIPLGIVSSFVKSGDEKSPKKKEQYSEEYMQYVGGTTDYKEVTTKDAIDMLYKKAKELGATGILNVKIDYIPSSVANLPQYFGYSASGMAIKKE